MLLLWRFVLHFLVLELDLHVRSGHWLAFVDLKVAHLLVDVVLLSFSLNRAIATLFSLLFFTWHFEIQGLGLAKVDSSFSEILVESSRRLIEVVARRLIWSSHAASKFTTSLVYLFESLL